MYRSPEEIWHRPTSSVGAMDMWAIGVVVTAVCGFPFTDVLDVPSLQFALASQLGYGQTDASDSLHLSQPGATRPVKNWPEQLLPKLDPYGIDLLTSCLTYDPLVRLNAGEGATID